ncbi:hypothetical protein ACV335_30385, partial [Pseudomonas aeruginosa]
LSSGARVIDAQLDASFDSDSGFRSAFARLLGEPPSQLRGRELLKADWLQTPLGAMLAVADAQALHLLAFFALSALPASDFILWGWRAPFLLSAVLVIVGMVIRLKLEESEDMKRVLAQKRTVKLPLAEVLGKHWKIVLLGAGV